MRLFILIALIMPTASADVLMDVMRSNWAYQNNESVQSCQCPTETNDDDQQQSEYDDPEPVHESWDLEPINPYADTEIIIL